MHFFQECIFELSSNFLPEEMQSYIDCNCVIFVQSVFSNVTSNHLPELMHNHIGYIRTIFLQHWFSFVSSNHQPELIHSHIDCICPIGCTCEIFLQSAHFQMFRQIPCPNWCIITIFIQRGFSFVPELMNSHIDCICSICLQSVLSYVSSKDLNVQMQVHIGHICLACPVLFCHITVRSFGGGNCHYSDKLLIEESWSSSWRVKLSLSHHSRRLIVIYWECVIVAFSTVIREVIKNIARIANAVPVTLY